MTKNSNQYLTKLWKSTPFSIFCEHGRQESEFISDAIQGILRAYNTFQESLYSTLKKLKDRKINIPAIIRIKQELTRGKSRVQQFIEQESNSISQVFGTLSELKFMIERSELEATRDFRNNLMEFMAKGSGLSPKKIQTCHQHMVGLNYARKVQIRDNPMSSTLQKWLGGFYVRTEDYFMKLYSYQWQDSTNRTDILRPFIRIKPESQLKDQIENIRIRRMSKGEEIFEEEEEKGFGEQQLRFSQTNEVKSQGRRVKLQEIERDSEMEQQQNDIVSQIYKQFHADPPAGSSSSSL